jgi:hypothetical protein
MVYGPLAHTIHSLDHLNESNARIYKQYVNSRKDAPLPPNGLQFYVDARLCMYAPAKISSPLRSARISRIHPFPSPIPA